MNILIHNKTLNLHTFNITPYSTCPGASQWCKQYCYAQKGNWRYENVVKACDYKYKLTIKKSFVERMTLELKLMKMKGESFFRLHSSGDFYNVQYIQKWIDIAKNVPNITILCFTKSWRVKGMTRKLKQFAKLPNVRLFFSCDNSTQKPKNYDKIAYVQGSHSKKRVNCKKELDKRYTCLSCKLCFNKNTKQVIFKPH